MAEIQEQQQQSRLIPLSGSMAEIAAKNRGYLGFFHGSPSAIVKTSQNSRSAYKERTYIRATDGRHTWSTYVNK